MFNIIYKNNQIVKATVLTFIGALILSACAETPDGPTALVLPGPNKSYEDFQKDKNFCITQAASAVDDQAEKENHRAILGSLLTAGLGTGLGAAIGGGTGAAIGAGGGALGGAGVAKGYSESKQGNIQTQYDNAFIQCMIAQKNVLPANRIIATPSSDEKTIYAH